MLWLWFVDEKLEFDESSFLDFIGDFLWDEFLDQSQSKLEAGAGAATRHDVSVNDNRVLQKETFTFLH